MRGSSLCLWAGLLVATTACSPSPRLPTANLGAAPTAAGARASADSSSPPLAATSLNWHASYDSQDRLSTLRDAAGQVTRFHYESDEHGRVRKVTREIDGGSSVSYDFDELGRLATLSDAIGRTTYEYDGFSRLIAVRRAGAAPVCYRFDTADRITRLTVGESSVDYRYDALGRLVAMETPAGRVTYDFQVANYQVHRTLPNGVVTTWQYSPGGKLASLTHTAAGRTLAHFAYYYRPDGRMERIDEEKSSGTSQATRWEYDADGRLTAAVDSTQRSSVYQYDAVGNRTRRSTSGAPAVASTFDWGGRLLTHKGQPCRYDKAGNVTDCLDESGPRTFRYTADNLLEQVDGRVTYEYDGWGNLVSRKTPECGQSFVPDPLAKIWRPLLALGSDGSRTFLVWEGDHLLAEVTSHGPRFLLEDQWGSIRCVADASGSVTAEPRFSPFGIPEKGLGNRDLQPGFASLFFDADTGLYLTKARAYHPDLGFLQPDPQHRPPCGAPWDLSSYTWCGHDPNLVDIDGCAPQPPANSFDHDWARRQAGRIANVFQAVQTSTATPTVNSTAATGTSAVRTGLGLPTVHFHSVLAVGWGDGAKRHEDLLRQAGGRFQLIDVTASSPRGIFLGDVPKAFNYDFVTARTFERSTPYTSDIVTAHSAGNHLRFSGDPLIVRIGPSSQNEQFNSGRSQIILPDLVTRVTKMAPTLDQGYAGVKVSGRFNSNPLEGASSLVKNVTDVGRGLLELPYAIATGMESHAKTTHFQTVDQMGVVPAPGTYRTVQVRTPSGISTYTSSDGSHWELKEQSTQLKQPDDPKQIGPPPGGPPPTSGSIGAGSTGQQLTYGTPFDGITIDLFGQHLDNLPSSLSKWTTEPVKLVPAGDIPSGPEVPSNIGGVYLGGAKVFQDCGQLRGVYFDQESGRLALLTEDGTSRWLPPLGLDEIVTVFRAVYSGEAPFVSIDPDPEDPLGKQMLIRHSQETAGTYTGWICFEADRLLKTASLGVDNVTGKPFRTEISGYQDLLNLTPRRDKPGNEQWERFWIVSGVERRQAANDGPAFLDISMSVKTQVMKLRGGKLESDSRARSSSEAAAFTRWFTQHYPEIETTLRSQPPAANGINQSITVFTELKRLALLTAAAEALRDQGFPLPSWMSDYRVKRFQMPETTPAIRTERQKAVGKKVYTQRVFGGVTLSPREGQGSRERPLSPAQEPMAAALVQVAADGPQLTPVAIERGGERLQAVCLPADRDPALGACQLREVDLAVRLAGGGTLELARRFHSFYCPRDIFGDTGWTLDLPRLERQLTEIGRTGDQVQYSVGFRLTSPLGSYSGTVQVEKGEDARLGRPSLVVRNERRSASSGGVAGAESSEPQAILHFDEESGQLLAVEAGAQLTLFRRDAEMRLLRLESWTGQRLEAAVQLDYDSQQRVVAAHDSNSRSVRYTYDPTGNLVRVDQPESVSTYQYSDGLVTEVGDARSVLRRLAYNNRGQLISESLAEGTEQQFQYDLTSDGKPRMTIRCSETDGTVVEREVCENGSFASWKTPGGLRHRLAFNPNARQFDWQLPAGGTYSLQRDARGHVVRVAQDSQPVFEQAWNARDQLTRIRWPGTEVRSDSESSGQVRTVRILEEGANAAAGPAMTVSLDTQGRPQSLADASGAAWEFTYTHDSPSGSRCRDAAGKLLAAVDCDWTSTGQLQSVRTSWGDEQHYAYENGTLSRLEILRAGKSATIEFQGGLPVQLRDFAGGQTELEYGADGQLIQLRTPSGLRFRYTYDNEGRLRRVACDHAYAWHYDYDQAGRLIGIAQVVDSSAQDASPDVNDATK